MREKRQKRSDIQSKYKWDLSSLYTNIDDWNKDIDKIQPLVDEIKGYQGKIMDSSHNLLELLKKIEKLNRLIVNLYVYANMRYHEDTTNNEAIANKGKIEKLNVEVSEQTFFVNPEILKSNYSLIEKYMSELDELKIYRFNFEYLFRIKPHTLSDEEEKLLASLGEIIDTSDDIYTTMHNADLKFGSIVIDKKKMEITDSNFVKLLSNNNQEIRKKVFKKYYKAYNAFKNTFATTLKYNVKSSSFVAKTRKYDNPLQMSLYSNDIDVSVYDNLIKAVNDNLSIIHKYIKLRKRELGVKQLHMYDIYAKMINSDKKEYSYEEAFAIVKTALAPLGEDYINLLDKAFNERWIDVYDNEGKKSGAYSWGTYDSKPYLLLNFDGTINSLSTLAHELGHSIHSYYTNKNQPYVYSNHAIFTAEVASTVNEILLNKYLFNNTTDKKQKKILLNELMEKFKGTLYRQTMFAEFEKIIFEKEAKNEVLTEQLISDIYYDLNKKYYGNDIIHDQEICLEWARIPHFYTPFYVYQYATGISAACAIASDILNNKPGFVEKYKAFLSSGTSDYPINLLKQVDVDMTKTEPIIKALTLFEDAINDYMALE